MKSKTPSLSSSGSKWSEIPSLSLSSKKLGFVPIVTSSASDRPSPSVSWQKELFNPRKKNKINKARFIDIDILDFKGKIINESLILPHPRLHLRKFVLEPLEKVSPSWEHPILKKRIAYLKSKIKTNEIIRKL